MGALQELCGRTLVAPKGSECAAVPRARFPHRPRRELQGREVASAQPQELQGKALASLDCHLNLTHPTLDFEKFLFPENFWQMSRRLGWARGLCFLPHAVHTSAADRLMYVRPRSRLAAHSPLDVCVRAARSSSRRIPRTSRSSSSRTRRSPLPGAWKRLPSSNSKTWSARSTRCGIRFSCWLDLKALRVGCVAVRGPRQEVSGSHEAGKARMNELNRFFVFMSAQLAGKPRPGKKSAK
jgi:hypothetical protein